MEENLNEGRTQIKRQYGQYSKIKVNEKAPVRNRVIGFVGKRFVTEEEMKNFLSKMNEDSGKTFDDKKWFGRNQRYFESFENRGQKVITLSKYGKRVLEMISKSTQKQTVNESIGLFKSEIFESLREENPKFELSKESIEEAEKALNEGVLAKKGAKELADINLKDSIDNGDPEMGKFYVNVSKQLGEKPENVIQVDSETYEDDPVMRKIYSFLEGNFNGKDFDSGDFGNSMGQACLYDEKLNVVRIDDYGFVAFYFTGKSNF